MVVTDGLPGIHAQVRTDTGWVDFALVSEGFSVPDEDGLIVLRARTSPVRSGGRRLSTGDGEFIGVYEHALVRVAVRFAEVNNVAVVPHWRGVSTRSTAVAVAVASWLRDTRAVTGRPTAVVTSARRPGLDGGFVAIPHAVRLAGEPLANIWEIRSQPGSGEGREPGPPHRRRDEPAGGAPAGEAADASGAPWEASWIIRPRPAGSGPMRVIRPGLRPPPEDDEADGDDGADRAEEDE